jgi:hypothetical protein
MFPPIYATCAADTSVVTLLTDVDGRLRLFPAGEAPQSQDRPYAVWQTIYGEPDNSLSCTPNTDLFGVQVDVYGPTLDGVRNVATALRNAIQVTAYVVRYNGESREAGAGSERHWRYSFDVEWRAYRA